MISLKAFATILALFFSLALNAQTTEKNYFKDAVKRDTSNVPPSQAAYPVRGKVNVELQAYSTIPYYKVEFFVYDAYGKLIYNNVVGTKTLDPNMDKEYTAYMLYTGPAVLRERGKLMEEQVSKQ